MYYRKARLTRLGTFPGRITTFPKWAVGAMFPDRDSAPLAPVSDDSEHPEDRADEAVLPRKRVVSIARRTWRKRLAVGSLTILGIVLGLTLTEASAATNLPLDGSAHQYITPADAGHPPRTGNLFRRIDPARDSGGRGASEISPIILATTDFLAFPQLPQHAATEYLGRLTQVHLRPFARPG